MPQIQVLKPPKKNVFPVAKLLLNTNAIHEDQLDSRVPITWPLHDWWCCKCSEISNSTCPRPVFFTTRLSTNLPSQWRLLPPTLALNLGNLTPLSPLHPNASETSLKSFSSLRCSSTLLEYIERWLRVQVWGQPDPGLNPDSATSLAARP